MDISKKTQSPALGLRVQETVWAVEGEHYTRLEPRRPELRFRIEHSWT